MTKHPSPTGRRSNRRIPSTDPKPSTGRKRANGKTSDSLTAAERRDLAKQERLIENNIDNPKRQGIVSRAIWRISRKRYYKRKYGYHTIDEYARKRFKIGYEYFRRLRILADAETVLAHGPLAIKRDDVQPPSKFMLNERQARPLAPLIKTKPEVIREVIEAAKADAVDSGKPMTGSHVARHVDLALAQIARQHHAHTLADSEASMSLPKADRFITGDCRKVTLPEGVDIVIVSPRYNINHDYGNGLDDNTPHPEYIAELRECFEAIVDMVNPFGRLCINIADTGTSRDTTARNAIRTLDHAVIEIMDGLDCPLLGRHVWDRTKASSQMGNYAGSFGQPSRPRVIRIHEHVLVFGKNGIDRPEKMGETLCSDTVRWREIAQSIWRIPPCGPYGKHPCPMPIDLPRRCLQMYAAKGDVVCDPMGGVGTVAIAADELGLQFYSIDQYEGWNVEARKRFVRYKRKADKG